MKKVNCSSICKKIKEYGVNICDAFCIFPNGKTKTPFKNKEISSHTRHSLCGKHKIKDNIQTIMFKSFFNLNGVYEDEYNVGTTIDKNLLVNINDAQLNANVQNVTGIYSTPSYTRNLIVCLEDKILFNSTSDLRKFYNDEWLSIKNKRYIVDRNNNRVLKTFVLYKDCDLTIDDLFVFSKSMFDATYVNCEFTGDTIIAGKKEFYKGCITSFIGTDYKPIEQKELFKKLKKKKKLKANEGHGFPVNPPQSGEDVLFRDEESKASQKIIVEMQQEEKIPEVAYAGSGKEEIIDGIQPIVKSKKVKEEDNVPHFDFEFPENSKNKEITLSNTKHSVKTLDTNKKPSTEHSFKAIFDGYATYNKMLEDAFNKGLIERNEIINQLKVELESVKADFEKVKAERDEKFGEVEILKVNYDLLTSKYNKIINDQLAKSNANVEKLQVEYNKLAETNKGLEEKLSNSYDCEIAYKELKKEYDILVKPLTSGDTDMVQNLNNKITADCFNLFIHLLLNLSKIDGVDVNEFKKIVVKKLTELENGITLYTSTASLSSYLDTFKKNK